MAKKAPARETRKVIMAGARAVLNDQGFAGVTTRRIGEAAGVNQALIHYHFGSIDQLLTEVMVDHAERQLPALAAILEGPGKFITKAEALIRAIGDPSVDARFPKLLLEITTLALSDPERLEIYVTKLARPGSELMRNAVLAELDATGPDAERTADQIVCLIQTLNRGTTLGRLVGLQAGHEDMVRATLDLVENLIAAHRTQVEVS